MKLSDAPPKCLEVADKVIELVNKAGVRRLQTFRNFNSRKQKIRIKLYGVRGYSMTPAHVKMLEQLGFEELPFHHSRAYSMTAYVDADDKKRLKGIVVPPVVEEDVSPYTIVREQPLSKDTPAPGQTWKFEGAKVTIVALAKEHDWEETKVVFHTGDVNYCQLKPMTAFRRTAKKVK